MRLDAILLETDREPFLNLHLLSDGEAGMQSGSHCDIFRS